MSTPKMEKEGKSRRAAEASADFVLQWGNRKGPRCLKTKSKDHGDTSLLAKSNNINENNNNNKKLFLKDSLLEKKKASSRGDRRVADKEAPSPQIHRVINKNSDSPMNGRKLSPEKEDRYYATRGSLGLDENGNGKLLGDRSKDEKGGGGALVWPRLFLTLSSKEKEEDFMAMKGCKLPQRPKKRAKLIQRTILLVSPGAWLTDLCQERYEVREKKTSKKRPRGLKAMGSMVESDSE